MAWIVDEAGTAIYQDDALGWRVSCRTGDPTAGLRSAAPREVSSTDARPNDPPLFRLLPIDGQTFPPLDESYIRGADLICRYPQVEACLFGLDVCHRIVTAEDSMLAIETICSVQTSLLDSHPTFDICSQLPKVPSFSVSTNVGGGGGVTRDPVSLNLVSSPKVPPAITVLQSSTSTIKTPHMAAVSLMLPPSDQKVAAVIPDSAMESSLRYRLLAEFLEKGVIRKARIWTVLWRQMPSEAQLTTCYQKLQAEPLPLTP